jgi:hypothetical protein
MDDFRGLGSYHDWFGIIKEARWVKDDCNNIFINFGNLGTLVNQQGGDRFRHRSLGVTKDQVWVVRVSQDSGGLSGLHQTTFKTPDFTGKTFTQLQSNVRRRWVQWHEAWVRKSNASSTYPPTGKAMPKAWSIQDATPKQESMRPRLN